MKHLIYMFLIIIVVIFPVYSEEDLTPVSAISIFLADSPVFAGFTFEFFTECIGLGISLGGFIVESNVLIEPGVYIRYYPDDIVESIYLLAGTSVLFSTDSSLNLFTGLGLHAIFGNKNRFRFAGELGMRFMYFMGSGFLSSLWMPHLQFMFGFVQNKVKKNE